MSAATTEMANGLLSTPKKLPNEVHHDISPVSQFRTPTKWTKAKSRILTLNLDAKATGVYCLCSVNNIL